MVRPNFYRPFHQRFYADALTEAERERLDAAYDVEDLNEEIAVMRVRLFTAIDEYPDDYRLMFQGISMIVRAVATQYRLSPRARKELADHLAATLNSIRDQLHPIG